MAMPHDVFICHSSQDKLVAKTVCDALEADGIRCWIAPRNIPPGMIYSSAILKAIEDCRVTLFVLSPHSNASVHVLREIELAVNRKAIIIPFRMEEIALSRDLQYFLSACQWFDAFPPPVDRHAARLAIYLRRLMKRPKKNRNPTAPTPNEPTTATAGGSLRAATISLLIVASVVAIVAVGFRLYRNRADDTRPRSIAAVSPPETPEAAKIQPAKTDPVAKSAPLNLTGSAGSVLVPEAPIRKTFKQQFEEIKADFEAQTTERLNASGPLLLRDTRASQQLLTLIEENAGAPEVPDALLWAVVNDCGDPSVIGRGFSASFPQLWNSGFRLRDLSWLDRDSWASEPFLRALLETHPARELKGIACLALGRHLKERSESAGRAGAGNAGRARSGLKSKTQRDGRFVVDDAGILRVEAETLFARAISDFGSVHVLSESIASLASAELYELKNLAVGLPIPAISETDSEGKPLRWSDYKGKIVVISFRLNIPPERAAADLDRWLAGRAANQPLVLLGINGNAEAYSARSNPPGRKSASRFWEDGKSIASRWNVRRWPVIYVIDHEGIIRDRFIGYKGTDQSDLETTVANLIRGVPTAEKSDEAPQSLPPKVTIVYPAPDFRFRQITERFKVEVVATSQDNEPVTGVEILVNGAAIPDFGKGIVNEWSEVTRRWTRLQIITLQEGVNTIEAIARTRHSASKKAVIKGTYAFQPMQRAPDPGRPIQKPYLGLIPNPKMKFNTGAWLFGVHLDSPAQKAGVKAGDILVQFNGRDIHTWQEYKNALGRYRPGQAVTIDVLRSGTSKSFAMNVGAGEED